MTTTTNRPLTPREFRMAITEVLIDHQLDLDERRQGRTETTWPDESDIYTGTVLRLRTLFKKQFVAQGWTPPPKRKASET